jgi:hypothetical protein
MIFPTINPAFLYVAGVALFALRSRAEANKELWLRDGGIAAGIGLIANFIPMNSPLSALLLVVAYVTGTLLLSTWLIDRYGHKAEGFSMRLMLLFSLVLAALFAMAIPLLLLALLKMA